MKGGMMKKIAIITVFGLLGLLLISVSCAQKTSLPAPAPGVPPAATSVPAPMMPGRGGGVSLETKTAALVTAEERMIVRNGQMSVVVKDVTQARDGIAQLAVRFEGYVVSSQISGEEQGMRGWISFRVPDKRFEEALTEIRKLATRVKSDSTNSQDVTEEYVDLKSRLKNAEATESQYLALLQKATSVEDTLKIYDSLSRVRSEIEQIKGRMQYLERTSAMSLITVQLEPEVSAKPLAEAGWSALEVLKSAVRGLITFGRVLVNVALWLIVFLPVWGTILGVILWRRRRNR